MDSSEAMNLAATLNPREVEIVTLLAEGLANQEIAERTGLTLYTVKWYLKQIYSKLYVSNRTQAAARARELGLLSGGGAGTTVLGTQTVPKSINTFFGREGELEAIHRLLRADGVRLVTLHGIGGMGKTRLALEAASYWSYLFPDGVIFVSLAKVSGSPLFEVMNTLRLPVAPDGDALRELGAFLYDKRCLIVLDNFEHLMAYAASITHLLERTHHVKVLVTSREVLNLKSESVLPLEGLPTRVTSDQPSAAQALFVQCAQAAYAGFDPDAADHAAIDRICELVGGMPLAIELAAGWAALLSPPEIARRLAASLDLLAADEQDRPPRHQNLRATFDYSFDLLDAPLQEVLLKLGVFHLEGFTLAAAEAVTGATPRQMKQMLDTALIQRNAEARFTFHPLIQQYVLERLQQRPDLLAQVRLAHGKYYFDLVMRWVDELRGALTLRVVQEFLPEIQNLDQAWHFALDQGSYDWLEAAVEIGYVCEMAELWKEADAAFANTFAQVPESRPLLRGRLLAFRTVFAFRANDIQTMRAFGWQAWDLLKESRYVWDAAGALCFLAVGEAFLGNTPEGLAILDLVDGLDAAAPVRPNSYVASVASCARPSALFFDRQLTRALPLLQTMQAPDWFESRIHLPECYLELGMLEEAHQALEELYAAGLDYGNHRLVVAAAFYLTLLDSPPETLLSRLVRSLIELTRMDIAYPKIALLGSYLASQLIRRGHPRWAGYLSCAVLHMLDELGAHHALHRCALDTARTLLPVDEERAAQILQTLAHAPECSPEIRQQARRALPPGTFTPHAVNSTPLLEILDAALIHE